MRKSAWVQTDIYEAPSMSTQGVWQRRNATYFPNWRWRRLDDSSMLLLLNYRLVGRVEVFTRLTNQVGTYLPFR